MPEWVNHQDSLSKIDHFVQFLSIFQRIAPINHFLDCTFGVKDVAYAGIIALDISQASFT